MLIGLALSIVLANLIIEFCLRLHHRALSLHLMLLLESALLLLLILPALYLMVLRPRLQQNARIRRVEAALRQSEERYRRIVESAQEGIWITDTEGITQFVNTRMAEMLGYAPDALLGQPYYTFMDAASCRDSEQMLASGPSCTVGQHDRCFVRRDGTLVWAISSVTQLTDDNGLPLGLMAMVTNITERKQAEQEIAHLASFPRLNPHPVVELTMQGDVRFANQGTVDTLLRLGVSPDGRQFAPADMDNLLARFAQDPNGSEYREVSIGEAVFGVHCTYVDATQTVRLYITEITRYKQAEAALRESERRYRELFEHMSEAVSLNEMILDESGTPVDWLVLDANPIFPAVTGVPREKAIGHRASDIFGQERMAYKLRYFTPMLLSQQPVQFELYSPFVEKYYRVWAFPLTNLQFASVILDTTEQVRAEQQVRLSGMVIDNTAEGVTITDPKGTIIFVNPAFTTITGYTAEDAIGQNPRILKSDRHDEAYYREMWQSLRAGGFWQGEIWNRRKTGEAYPEWLTISAVRNGQGQLTHYVAVFHDITDMKQQAERIQYQAYHDALTGLPNRTLFLDRLEQALAHAQRQRELLGVIFLDLDRFKAVNDSLGHMVGDLLLQAVAERLQGSVRADDTVARLGGDEFIILLADLAREEDAAHVAEKVQAAFVDPFHIQGHDLFITPSMGVTLYPTDGDEAGTLLQNADVALYRAKEQGRNTYRLYLPAMNDRALERLELENHLRKAVENQEFRLVYQPRVDVATGTVTSAEALIRWEHPELGTVMPGSFIPQAEETGLILSIGEWVLGEACRQAKAWQQAGMPPVRVAVNVSGRQFAKGDLVDVVRRTLDATGLAPEYLEIEITESVAMTDVAGTLATLRALHACGVWIAIDDFGTSYSSLGYLKQFPLHALKIDQSFVREIPDDPNSVTIATAIISMAHALHLHVIAEGVETEAQLNLLHRHACDEVQGYLFSKPIPPDEFRAAFLANGTLEARELV